MNNKSAAILRPGCVSLLVVEPSCSARCSFHAWHCFALRRIASDRGFISHASKLAANCSSTSLAVPTTMGSRVAPVYTSQNSGFPSSPSVVSQISRHRFHPRDVQVWCPTHQWKSFQTLHVTTDGFEYCCCQLKWVSLSRCRPPDCCHACAVMLTSAGCRQRFSEFQNVGGPSWSSLARSFLPHVFHGSVPSDVSDM